MDYLADTVTIIRHFSKTGAIGKEARNILATTEKGKHRIHLSVLSLDRAGEILKRDEALQLSERDAMTFLHALENPPTLSKKLIMALKAHSQLVTC